MEVVQQGAMNHLPDLKTTYFSHILWPRVSRLIPSMQALGEVLKGKDDSVFLRIPQFPGDRAGLAALARHGVTSESRGLHGWCSPCRRQPRRATSATCPLLLRCNVALPGTQHPCLPWGLGLAGLPRLHARTARATAVLICAWCSALTLEQANRREK